MFTQFLLPANCKNKSCTSAGGERLANCRCVWERHCQGPRCDSKDIYRALTQLYESHSMFWEPDVDYTMLRRLEKRQHTERSLKQFRVLNCGEIYVTSHLSFEPFLTVQLVALSTFTRLCKPHHHPFPELFFHLPKLRLCTVGIKQSLPCSLQ